MKKLLLLIIIIFTLMLTSCHGFDNTSATFDNNSLPKIVATSFPQYDFARQIAGEKADITMLLSPGSESHSYEPSPQDIIKIQESDLFIFTGGESDSWIEGILSSVSLKNLEIVKLMELCPLIEIDSHDHSHDKSSHEYDQHVWTSPKNVKLIIKNLCDTLCKINPDDADYYTQNYENYLSKIEKLDLALLKTVENAKRNTLIFADRFPFAYLAKDYGLEYYSAFSGCSEQTEPSIKTVTELIGKIKDSNIPTVFYIEFSNQKLADTIKAETGAKTALLHSCHNVTREEFQNGITYVDLMNKNIDVLSEALN